MNARLVGLTLIGGQLHGFGRLDTIAVNNPLDRVRGWRAVVHGPAVFLVTPPGWGKDKAPNLWDPDGPRLAFEVPRSMCHLQWEIAAELGAHSVRDLSMFESEPFDRPRPSLEVLPPQAEVTPHVPDEQSVDVVLTDEIEPPRPVAAPRRARQ